MASIHARLLGMVTAFMAPLLPDVRIPSLSLTPHEAEGGAVGVDAVLSSATQQGAHEFGSD